MIGQFIAENQKNVLHIFITPDLDGVYYFINALQNVKPNVKFNSNSLFSHTNLTEGDQTFKIQAPQTQTLNQDFCICDHHTTQQIFNPRRYKNLGIMLYLFFNYFILC
jgi:hydrogenase maturation factor HypF (carbamoyltransferase family)